MDRDRNEQITECCEAWRAAWNTGDINEHLKYELQIAQYASQLRVLAGLDDIIRILRERQHED